MKCYIISYESLSSGQDYKSFYNAIKSYGSWAHISKFVWAIVTDDKASEVRENLKSFLNPKDRIFVIRSGGEAAWKDVVCSSEWLKKNL